MSLSSKMRIVIIATTVLTTTLLIYITLIQMKLREIDIAQGGMLLSAKYNADNILVDFNSGLQSFNTYALALSGNKYELPYSVNIVANQLMTMVKQSNNVTHGFLYLKNKDYLNAPNRFAIDDALLITVQSNGILETTQDISQLPVIQETINTGNAQITNPIVFKLNNQEIKAITFAFPIFDSQRHVIGVLGGIFNIQEIATDFLKLRNNSYPNEAKVLTTHDGTIIAANNQKIVGLNLRALTKMAPHLHDLIERVMQGNEEFTAYLVDTSKQETYAAHANMRFDLFPNTTWHIVTLTPKSDVLAEYYDLRVRTIIIGISIQGVLFIVLTLFVKYQITDRLLNLSRFLEQFFKYINHEGKKPKILEISTFDEIGKMAQMVGDNIQRTQLGLDKDALLVKQATATAQEVESGNFTARILEESHNPQLQDLKDVLNHMLATLEEKVGRDMNEIQKVFDAYTNLDFTIGIESAKGRVEVVTNALGQEIAEMLRTSANFAQNLTQQCKILEDAVAKLTESSNTQASHLEQTATAVEQITSSMQSVSGRTNEVIGQSEDINGRGFAVVADEVRKLAERTQKSLGEIEANTNILVQSINDMAESIKEQTSSITQINETLSQLETTTQNNVVIAQDTQNIANNVNAIADDILKDVNTKKF